MGAGPSLGTLKLLPTGALGLSWWKTFFDRAIAETILRSPRPGELEFLQRELCLSERARIFDQCCGWGRISEPLSQLGYQVVGVDGSPELIELGRSRSSGVEFHLADAAEFKSPEPCAAAMNLFSSFGCTDDDEQNGALLQRLSDSLQRGGRAVLDTINPGRILADFQTHMETAYPNGTTMRRTSQLDWSRGLLHQEWTVSQASGQTQVKSGFTKLYLPHTLAEMLDQAGLEPLHLYGDLRARPFETTSERLIWIAEKR